MKKKYTVYEIEKLTDGKISKYKLNKAIEDKELPAEVVHSNKKGRGVPKYFVYEDDLNNYLKKVSLEKSKKILIPGEHENEKEKIKNNLSVTINEQIKKQHIEIETLKAKINMLEKTTQYPTTNQQSNKFYIVILVLFGLLYLGAFLFLTTK